MLRRLTVLVTALAAALLALATPAWAHVELEPTEAVAGSTASLTFRFHHGKDGTATTALEVKLPEGATVVEVGAVEGFTSAQDEAARTVRWEGGSIPDGDEGAFPLRVQLPTEPGVGLFPTIQETEAGDLAWISEEEGEDVDAAPRITLTADLPGTTLEAADDGDDDEAAPWLIGAGIAAIVVIAVGGWLLKRRTDADRAGGTAPSDSVGDVPPS